MPPVAIWANQEARKGDLTAISDPKEVIERVRRKESQIRSGVSTIIDGKDKMNAVMKGNRYRMRCTNLQVRMVSIRVFSLTGEWVEKCRR